MKQFIQEYRIIISFVVVVLVFWMARPTFGSILIGIPFVLLGEGIRTWASGYIRKNDALATGGPYAYTRNPLYLGSFLMGVGFGLMTARLPAILILLFFFVWIYQSTIQKEEEVLLSKFGDEFLQYKNRVNRFFPRRPRQGSSFQSRGFDWELVKRHREYQTWLGATAGVLLMIGKGIFL